MEPFTRHTGIAAPLLYISNNQLNVQVPLSVAAGNQTVQISGDGVFSNTAFMAVAR